VTVAAGTDVLVVDDENEPRALAKFVLEREGLRVVAATGSYDTAIEAAATADVAVVDLRLGGRSGIELARDLTARGVKVVIYTAARDREALRAALQSGALGLALKGEDLSELPRAVTSVVEGRSYVSPAVAPLLARPREATLTPREREVLFLLATGLTNEQLAAQLGLSPDTTRTQLKTAMRKLGATTRVHAVAIAVAQGEIDLPG
jgi:DNA-binding NarL/FixJ family response regulator